MPSHTFTTSRITEADPASLLAQLRAQDATAGVVPLPGPSYRVTKATAWTAPQIAGAQTVIDTAPAATPQLLAQAQIDAMPIATKAILLTLLDQINTLRSKVSPPLVAITPAQVVDAVRTKAGTL